MRREEALRSVLGEALGTPDYRPEDRLKEDLGLDSLSLVGVIVGLEEAFGITFDDGDLDPERLVTVQNILDLMGEEK